MDERRLPEAVAQTCADLVTADVLSGVAVQTLLAANQQAFASIWPAAEQDWTLGGVDGATLSLEIWRRALQACGCTDASVARLAVEILKAHLRNLLRLYEDVAECLRFLEGRTRLGLVTNGAADDQRERLAWLDLAGRFDSIVISAEVGVAKPQAAIFEVALEQLALSPDDVWHVGDSVRYDVAGAKAAGLTAVWLNRERAAPGPVRPDLEVSSLGELTEAIRGVQ